MKILLINDTENPEKLAMIIGFDLGLKDHRVRAIFQSLEYALKVLASEPEEFKFIVVDSQDGLLVKRIELLNTLSHKFPNIQVISTTLTTGRKYTRSDTPNLHFLETLEGAARFIAIHPNSKKS